MPRIGFPELMVILIIALVLFGPGKLPAMGKAVGETLKEFKKATGELIGGTNTVASTEAKAETKMDAKIEDIKSEDVK